MASRIEILANALQRTLSPDMMTRKTAENELKAMENQPGHGVAILELASKDAAPSEIRLAAVVALKNYVKRNWGGDGDATINDAERLQIREESLRLMFLLAGNLRKQLSSTVCEIGQVDFPSKWPALVEVLSANLATQNLDHIIASLDLLDDLSKKYRTESKSQELWVELKFVLDNLSGPLLALFQSMMGFYDQRDAMPADQCLNWLEILHLIASNFCSLSSQDLPEPFEDNINIWMTGYQTLLGLKIPSIEQSADDKVASPLENLKVSICEIITLYTQRYEEETAQYVSPFIQGTWEQLVEIDHRYRFDSLVNACLGLLSAICQRVQYKQLFQAAGVLNTLCESIIVKNLVIRDDDIENFEDGSAEYINRDLEGSDFETRRRGASDFVRALCKNFEAEVFPILGGIITNFLAEYQANPVANWRQKDVIYCLVTAMASKGSTHKHGVVSTSNLVNVGDFYTQYVREDIIGTNTQIHPILRADAIKYVVTFRSMLPIEAVAEAMQQTNENQGVIGLLRTDDPLLHQYAAHAIERLLCMKQNIFNASNTQVAVLIDLLVKASQSPRVLNTHYIAKALMRCINIIDEESARSATVLVDYLAALIDKAVKEAVDPGQTHYVFESLCVLMKRAYRVVGNELSRHILPIMMEILTKDITDLIPYALQVIALMVDETKAITGSVAQYADFLPMILKEEVWARKANIPAALLVVESFISGCPEVVFGGDYRNRVLGLFQGMLRTPRTMLHGFRLAACILPHVGRYPELTDNTLLMPMLRQIQTNKTTLLVKNFTLFMCRYSIKKDALELARNFETIQNGMYPMILEKIILPEVDGLAKNTTFQERQALIMGFAHIIGKTAAMMGALFPKVVEGACKIASQSGANTQLLQADEEEDANEVIADTSDPFSRLSNAQHADDLYDIKDDVKKALGMSVLQMVAQGERGDSFINMLNGEIHSQLTAFMRN
ncbi:hypothetical protein QR680_001065 [Steinernema hermaphroditum]|uniref:Exportin-2 n=1 Tax=Steinernema hermaphroditum TaxID=289476 RepID=A0AA39GWZ6_9BILA|nr:hypothetical protein QR680_001065 [Steinernema hermaphroditum]